MFRLRISEGESGRDVLPRLSAFLELEHPAGGAGHGLRLVGGETADRCDVSALVRGRRVTLLAPVR